MEWRALAGDKVASVTVSAGDLVDGVSLRTARGESFAAGGLGGARAHVSISSSLSPAK